MRGKREKKRKKRKERKKKGRKKKKKTCEARWSKVGCDFLLLQAFQVSSKWNQGREAKEKTRKQVSFYWWES